MNRQGFDENNHNKKINKLEQFFLHKMSSNHRRESNPLNPNMQKNLKDVHVFRIIVQFKI